MADDIRITASPNGRVNVSIPEKAYEDGDAYDLVELLMATAYKSRALQEVDRVMGVYRRQFHDFQSEWQLLDKVWRDLRLAFGYDDNPKAGSDVA